MKILFIVIDAGNDFESGIVFVPPNMRYGETRVVRRNIEEGADITTPDNDTFFFLVEYNSFLRCLNYAFVGEIELA